MFHRTSNEIYRIDHKQLKPETRNSIGFGTLASWKQQKTRTELKQKKIVCLLRPISVFFFNSLDEEFRSDVNDGLLT